MAVLRSDMKDKSFQKTCKKEIPFFFFLIFENGIKFHFNDWGAIDGTPTAN